MAPGMNRSFAATRLAAALAAVLALAAPIAACGLHQDIEEQEADPMKPGPGLFSGKDGVFTVYPGGGGDAADKKDEAQD
jgi:hypothetical protein